MDKIKTKVCIVGSGIAGCLCAKFLAKKVDDILIVERGASVSHEWTMQTGHHEKAVPTAQHHHIVAEGRQDQFAYLYTLGGTTNHWTGQSPRFLPNDFKMRSLYGIMDDWPISYDDLEPFYCLAEEELAIAGASDNPWSPRSKPYPLPPHPFSPADLLAKQCFPAGSVVASPQARPTQDVNLRPACCGSATCSRCPVDSKYTPLNTHVPQLEALSNVRILTETVVLELKSSGKKVQSAVAKKGDGRELVIEADLFVLAANALENPAILLRSSQLPQHPLTGRFLFDHPVLIVSTLISKDGFPYYGNSFITASCYYFYDGTFRNQRAGALGDIMNTPGLPPFDMAALVAVETSLSGKRLREETANRFRKQVSLAFLLDDIPDPNRLIRISKKRNRLGIPETEIYNSPFSQYLENGKNQIIQEIPKLLSSLGPKKVIPNMKKGAGAGHLLGTCRMSDERHGVVDTSLRYHPVDNLFILGGSAFPTYSPANPTLTIAALAIRLASHLA